MADSTVFEWVCQELERATSLDRIESRGTVRIAIKQAGLAIDTLSTDDMTVVLRRVMVSELSVRNISDCEQICEDLATRIVAANLGTEGASGDLPEAIFGRLGKS